MSNFNFKESFKFLNSYFLSEKLKEQLEKVIVIVAIVSFGIHLVIIGLIDFDILDIGKYDGNLIISPISAIYTPFSIILIYEVYLLVFYLPKSITNYIGKQYEIITLILIRKIFYDLSNLEFSSDWFSIEGDIQFTIDLIATLILFFLIFQFYRLNSKNKIEKEELTNKTKTHIKVKNVFATILVPVIVILAIFSFGSWLYETLNSTDYSSTSIKTVNTIFFDDFFTVLILIDVLLLLFSFLQTEEFSRVIRNSGFVISTILIKLSFSADNIINTILIVVAVSFGVLILYIYNQYFKLNQRIKP
ncbi:hypothetical protein P700755_003103 [Psychroflexus torquis ATCC 700755]|uniref:Uncharacterized protein n=1 Tax=Psychroflexus torquis (strain ATCC 700755 / CIP 106069 / ACAM 623) TaxID=313595 RepID=K4IIW1_PSYTT|nr:hypothetical protein [Psychroflexus torquis]AFU69773.1 hypothetical protein P700755_003103 [Psychroflexus torquis ATCC 700755]